MYGICENKCFVEVSPKTDTDAVKDRVDRLEDNTVKKTGNETISGAKTFNSVLKINPGADWRTLIMNTNIKKTGENGKTFLIIYDEDKYPLSSMQSAYSVVNNVKQANTTLSCRIRKSDDSSDIWSSVKTVANENGTIYATGPTTPADSTGTEIITANALNSWASVVHTVGNEEISGNKSFSGSIIFNNTAETGMKDIVFNFGADKTRYGLIRSEKGGISTRMSITAYNKNNLSEFASIVVGYDTNGPFTQAPATPSNANGNEIATAGWVKNTINSTVPVTKNTLIINSVETLKQALDLMRNGAIGAIGLRLNYKGNALGCTITGFNAHLTYGTYKYGITGGYHSNIETKTFHELVHWYESNPDKLVIYGNYDGELVIGADITIDSGKYVYFE